MSVRQRVFSMSMASGEPTTLAESQPESDLTGAAALGVGGSRHVGRAVVRHEVLEPTPSVPMKKQGKSLRPVFFFDANHVLGDDIQGFVPSRFLEDFLAPFLDSKQRHFQTIRIIEKTDTSRSPRAEPPAGEGVGGVADDLGHLAVLDMSQDAAFPEAELTKSGDNAIALGLGVVDAVAVEAPPIGSEIRRRPWLRAGGP